MTAAAHRRVAAALLSTVLLFALVHNCSAMIPPQQRTRRKPPRELPAKVLIGYATQNMDKVVHAVRTGVNLVVWSFVEFNPTVQDGGGCAALSASGSMTSSSTTPGMASQATTINNGSTNNRAAVECVPSFDLDRVKQTIDQLDREGFDDTIHLVSFGGWNGPHLPSSKYSADDMYQAWKWRFGQVFDGVDWDLEGNDNLQSPFNILTVDCLEAMGQFSQLAKSDGFLVGMAPAQSYLDLRSSNFSRLLNLTDADTANRDMWHDDFHYFGSNSYFYLLSKFQDAIDFVSVQFYESFSRAGLNCYHYGVSQEDYLEQYVEDLVKKETSGGCFVDFELDAALNYASRRVSFPLSKLVFGFANGWGVDGDKVCYFAPQQIKIAYERLEEKKITPRGFMYWVIDEEGTNDVYFASSMNEILHTRVPSKKENSSSSNS